VQVAVSWLLLPASDLAKEGGYLISPAQEIEKHNDNDYFAAFHFHPGNDLVAYSPGLKPVFIADEAILMMLFAFPDSMLVVMLICLFVIESRFHFWEARITFPRRFLVMFISLRHS
jgi:hypothetical protein